MATPNYKPFIGQLATSRYDFQAHIEGAAFRHNGYAIDMGPTATYPTAATLYIKGVPYYTVADALYALAGDITSDGYGINSFVYRAGSGLTGPVIFGTFDGAVNAANTLGGAESTIIVDDTVGLATASGAYNLSGVNLLGVGSPSVLTFQNGSSITNLWSHLERLRLTSASNTPIVTVPVNAIINIGLSAAIYGSSSSSFFVINSTPCAIYIVGGFIGDGTNPVATVISSMVLDIVISVYGGINNNAISGAGGLLISADWSTFIIGTQTVANYTVIRPTITQLQGIPVPYPSGANTVLTYNAGSLTWGAGGGGGGGSVTGSGLWHSTSGTLDGVASVGTVGGQFSVTNAAHTDTVWVSLSGDVTDSATTPGLLTVVGIYGTQVSATAPTTGQVLGYNGTNWIPTNFPAGSAVTGSGFWHSTGSVLDAAASVGTVGGQFAVTNAGHTDIAWVNLSGDTTDSASTPGQITVVGIHGNPVSPTAATPGQFLIENSSATGSVWTSISGTDVSASVSTVGLLTVTGIRGISVPAPSVNNTVLTFNTGAFSWAAGSGGSVTGSGFWHSTGGVLDGAASVGTVGGQFAVTNAAHNNTVWVSLSGDVIDSAATPGLLTVIRLQTIPISATAPTSGQVLEYNGTNWIPTNLPAGSAVTGSGFWHSTSGTLDAAASVGTVGGQFAVTNAAHTNTAWVSLSGDVTDSAATPGLLTVVGIQGNPVSATASTPGQFLIENAAASGSVWTSISGDSTASVSTVGLLTTVGLRGIPISVTAPTPGQILGYNGTNWVPTTPASSAAASSFVYKQGSGGTGPVVFNTLAGAVSAANAQGGPCVVEIDTSIAAGTTTAIPYNLANITLIGAANTPVQLTFITGSSITNIWQNLINVIAISSSSSPMYTPASGTKIFIGTDAAVLNPSGTPFFAINQAGIQIIMGGPSFLGDGSVAAATVSSGKTLVIQAGDGANVSVDALTGTGAVSITASVGSVVSSTQTITGFGISYTFQGLSLPVPSVNNTVLTYNAGAFLWSSSGSSVVWNNDLLGSTSANQYINSISGHAGSGGTVALNITTLNYTGTTGNITLTGSNVLETSSTSTILNAPGSGSIFLATNDLPIVKVSGATGAVSISDRAGSPLWAFTEVPSTIIPAIYAAGVSAGAGNYTLIGGTSTILNNPTAVKLAISANPILTASNSGILINDSAANPLWNFTEQPSTTTPAIYAAGVSPSTTNYAISATSSETIINSTSAVLLTTSAIPVLEAASGNVTTFDASGNPIWQLTEIPTSSDAGLYYGTVTPGTNNYTLLATATSTLLNAPNGTVGLASAGQPYLGMGTLGLNLASQSPISIATAFIVLTPTQYAYACQVFTGAVPSGGCTITYPANGGPWYVDLVDVTFASGFALTFFCSGGSSFTFANANSSHCKALWIRTGATSISFVGAGN